MLDAPFRFLARVQEGVMHNAAPGVPLGSALGKLVGAVLALIIARLVAKVAPRLDAMITRYERQLLFFAVVGLVAYFMGQVAVMLTVAAGASVTVWWLERRRRRNPHEKKDSRRRAVVMSTVAVLLFAVGVGAAQYKAGQVTRGMSRFCLLLSFKPTSPSTIDSWVNFASTWKDVFSGVEGVTISPNSATSDDFNKFSDESLVRSLKPDLVLKTTVYTPGESISLISYVYTDDEMKSPVDTFQWQGSRDEIQHTALGGAARLLRYLHTATDRPLSDTQHGQAARNLLNVYLLFLKLHHTEKEAATSVEVQKTLDASAPITDERIATLLDAFDISTALEHDAKREAEARTALLAKLPR